jgi:hypothetical protein
MMSATTPSDAAIECHQGRDHKDSRTPDLTTRAEPAQSLQTRPSLTVLATACSTGRRPHEFVLSDAHR